MADIPESGNPLETLSQQEYEHYRRSGEMPASEGTPAPSSDLPPAEAPPAEEKPPESDTGEPDDDNPAEFTKRGLSKRFAKLTQARRDAEARVAALEQQLSRLEQGSRPVNNAVQQPAGAPGEPKQEDYETFGEWQAALIDARVEQRLQRERQAAAEYVQRQQAHAAQAEWQAKLELARAKHEDYDDVVDAIDVPQTPAVPAIIDAIRQSDAGTEISYFLAKHPQELARIAELSPTRAVAEVGKLEAKLTGAPAPAAAKVSGAPKPPALATGRARTDVSIYDEELSYPEYERLRMEEIKRRQY